MLLLDLIPCQTNSPCSDSDRHAVIQEQEDITVHVPQALWHWLPEWDTMNELLYVATCW